MKVFRGTEVELDDGTWLIPAAEHSIRVSTFPYSLKEVKNILENTTTDYYNFFENRVNRKTVTQILGEGAELFTEEDAIAFLREHSFVTWINKPVQDHHENWEHHIQSEEQRQLRKWFYQPNPEVAPDAWAPRMFNTRSLNNGTLVENLGDRVKDITVAPPTEVPPYIGGPWGFDDTSYGKITPIPPTPGDGMEFAVIGEDNILFTIYFGLEALGYPNGPYLQWWSGKDRWDGTSGFLWFIECPEGVIPMGGHIEQYLDGAEDWSSIPSRWCRIYNRNFSDPAWKNWTTVEYVEGGEPIEGGGIMSRYSPRIGSKAIEIALADRGDVKSIIKTFWDFDISHVISDTLFGKPIDSLLGLRFYYGMREHVKRSPGAQAVRLGRTTMEGVSVPYSESDFASREFKIPAPVGRFGNFLDYAPYTQYEIFIPFVGWRSLDVQELYNSDIRIIYNVSLATGVTLVLIQVNGNTILQESTNMGIDIPVNVQKMDGLLRDIASLASASATLAVPGAGAVASLGMNFANTLSGNTEMARSSSLTNENGNLSEFDIITKVTRPIPFNLEILEKIGYKFEKFGSLSQGSTGLITIEQVADTSSLSSCRYKGEILAKLKDGIYLGL